MQWYDSTCLFTPASELTTRSPNDSAPVTGQGYLQVRWTTTMRRQDGRLQVLPDTEGSPSRRTARGMDQAESGVVGTEKACKVERGCLGRPRVSGRLLPVTLQAAANKSTRQSLENYPPPLDWDKIAAELGYVKS